jgi:hypothetical protein
VQQFEGEFFFVGIDKFATAHTEPDSIIDAGSLLGGHRRVVPHAAGRGSANMRCNPQIDELIRLTGWANSGCATIRNSA